MPSDADHGATTEPAAAPSWLDRSGYPWAPQFAQVREGRMHYVDTGSGDPVLFSHGTPTWSFEYRHVIRVLSDHRRCVAPDHLGFGLSERPRRASYAPEAHAERLREFVDAVGLQRFALVAHDYGGPIALPLAIAGRVTRLVLLNTWMWPFDDDREMRRRARLVSGGLGRLLYRNANASLRFLMPSAYGNRFCLTKKIHAHYLQPFADPDDRVLVLWPLARALLGASAFYADLLENAGVLSGIPTTIIWGMKDSAFRPHLLSRWRALMPHAVVHEVAGVGHWPHEEAPSEVAELIGDFLAADAG